jgi:O-methyltransferase involved in polyketide biosynthesis
VGVLGATPQLRAGTARVAAAAARLAAAAAQARPVVLRDAGAVLAVTTDFDASVPNMSRVYDYWLGGKDHYAADRAEASRLLGIYPPLADLVRENRRFLAEAVGWAAGQGIAQFIDLGAGLPTRPNVHQVARGILPAARVAYVDTDPVVLCHVRALLAGDGVMAVAADLRDPAAVLADPDLRAVIDPDMPVGVILGAVLHFLDADAARAVTAGYARLLAPGSYLIISCASYDDEALAKRLSAEYTAAAWHNHTRAEIESFFAGLDLVAPGLSEAKNWAAWLPEPVPCHRTGHVLAGVARIGATDAEPVAKEG